MAAWLARASQAARAGEYALEEPGSFSYWIGRASQKRKADKTPEVSPTKSDASTSSKVGDDEASLLELGDDEASLLDNDVDDEPPKSRASKMAGNQNASGSSASRWAKKIEESTVDAEIIKGCQKDCGCVHKFGLLSKEKSLALRDNLAGMRDPERRVWMRAYLDRSVVYAITTTTTAPRAQCACAASLTLFRDSTLRFGREPRTARARCRARGQPTHPPITLLPQPANPHYPPRQGVGRPRRRLAFSCTGTIWRSQRA